jgi:nicotinamide riboside kinase
MESKATPRMASGRRGPCLALTGSAGVGKTSLGHRLAAELGVPFIPEGMRTRIEAGLDLHTLSREQHRTLLEELFEEMLAATRDAVTTRGGFVADRCSIDCAAFWLYYGFGNDAEATAEVFETAAAALELYGLVVVLPWDGIPLAADGVRSANRWHQLHYQSLLEGLLARWAPEDKVALMPADIVDVDARANWVRERLKADSAD